MNDMKAKDRLVEALSFTQYAKDDKVIWRMLVGQQIAHRDYGEGTVTKIESTGAIWIQFDGYSKTDSQVSLPREHMLVPEAFRNGRVTHLTVPSDIFPQVHAIELQEQQQRAKAELERQRIQEARSQRAIEEIIERLNAYLGAMDLENAENYFRQVSHLLPGQYIEKYEEDRRNVEEYLKFLVAQQRIQRLMGCLNSLELERADAYYQEIERLLSEADIREYQEGRKKAQAKVELIAAQQKLLKGLRKLLEQDRFWDADRQWVLTTPVISADEYTRVKAQYIGTYIKRKYSKMNEEQSNEEQLLALANTSPSLLLAARAGSGKTRVLASKAGLLIDGYSVNPDTILILAFNGDAAATIGNRIRRDLGIETYANARTFHSLAYQLVMPENPTEKLLLDDGRGEFSQPKFSMFVQKILRKNWDPILRSDILYPEFRTKLYQLFRKEMLSMERVGSLLDNADYIGFVRDQRDITLGGDRVKSVGEKYIADFLFEHDIPYAYESVELWSGHNYRPDFRLFKVIDAVIEFWGIDEDDSQKNIPRWWNTTWEQYRDGMTKKREYWKKKKIPLIELSVADLRGGRERFELKLSLKLQSLGIHLQRLPQEKLEAKVIRKNIDRMTDLFVRFIQKAKQRMWSFSDVRIKVMEYDTSDEREQLFLTLACRVYQEYQEALDQEDKYDFDDLLIEAARKIEATDGQVGISLGTHKDRFVQMRHLRWIMIDEYQDFTPLFHNLVDKIRKVNPDVHLLCVGDNWQAINTFAGSELRFFHNANAYFPGIQRTYLLTNWRSQKSIVEAGNALMKGLGEPAVPLISKNRGQVHAYRIDGVWIESRKGADHEDARAKDQRFVFLEQRSAEEKKMNDNGFLQAKYLKACYEIIISPDNYKLLCEQREKDKDGVRVAILSRTNRLYRVSLSSFHSKLRSCFSQEQLEEIGDFENKVKVSTVHSYKGLQADLVIILRACEGVFPLMHPDTLLFGMFGDDFVTQAEDERRLFYVALTRAKEKLYLLTEEGRESIFLDQANIPVKIWGSSAEPAGYPVMDLPF